MNVVVVMSAAAAALALHLRSLPPSSIATTTSDQCIPFYFLGHGPYFLLLRRLTNPLQKHKDFMIYAISTLDILTN
jgi:hypothetical protein